MSEILSGALSLAKQQVRLFPVRAGEKVPAVTDFSHKATSNASALEALFSTAKFNSGIACGKVAEGLYLVGFDIDNKPGRNGYESLELLEELGCELPETWSQKTPSGGEHRLFWSPVPIRQGANTVGLGIDLRGEGGYLVGPGSSLPGGVYRVLRDLPIAAFPRWAIAKFEKKATVHHLKRTAKPIEDQVTALRRSVEFLQSQPVVHEGHRSHDCFRVVAKLKDFGLDQAQVPDVLLEYWKCEPMLEEEELLFTVNNGYRYSKNPVGALAPENLFEPVLETTKGDGQEPPEQRPGSPLEKMNEHHFFYAADGVTRVCWETQIGGEFHLERFPVPNFHEKHAAVETFFDGKTIPLTKAWVKWSGRRSYDGLRFDPTCTLDKNFYNLWRGFAVKMQESPITPSTLAAESVNLFLQHIRENVCGGDEKLADWLLTFIAHMFQKPGEKPEVALVMRGLKGTGKTIVSEILGHLIGDHSVILADKSLVVGHFNSVMEDKILITLDEAFWSGDKAVEGTLKHIITGRHRVITHKGHEPYKAKVYDRIVIVGNEHWLVPATADERRYAVFDVGSKRRRDRDFFGKMKEGLTRHGGDRLLMDFFMSWDLGKANVNIAPQTDALASQKELSLNDVQGWWHECLNEGKLLGAAMDHIPEEIKVSALHDAFAAYNTKFGKRLPTVIGFGMTMKPLLPQAARTRTSSARLYKLGTLAELRRAWDHHFDFKSEWHDPFDDLI